MHPATVDRRWPWGVAGVAAVLTVAGAPLAVANASVRGVEEIYLGDTIAGMVVPAAGALVVSRTKGQRVGWVLLSTVGLAVSFFLASWSRFGLHTVPGSLPLADWAGWISEITWLPFLAVLTLLPLWFPTGRVPSRWWLPLQVWVLALLAVLLVACVLHPRLEDGTPAPLTSGLPDVTLGLSRTITTLIVFSSIACLAALGVRYLRADAGQRATLRWFVLAVAVAVAVTFLPGIPTTVADVLTGLAFSLVAASVAVAVLGRGLYGIDVVVDRSLVFAIAAAATYVLYVVVVTALGSLVPEAAGFLGVAAVAVAFAPLHTAATRAVDRFLRGARADPLAALASVDEHLDARHLDVEPAGSPALDAVRAALHLSWAAVVEDDGGGPRMVAASGRRSEGARTLDVPMTAGGRRVGTLVVAGHAGAEPLGDRDRGLLEAFARPLARALEQARLADALQAARERLVHAREDERRRLHRDLHDGLGPVLSHAVLGLDGARHLAGADAGPSLVAIKEELQEALADLRRLVHGLRPAPLDDTGLGDALARHVARVDGCGVDVGLVVGELPDELPAAVEVAVYRIAAEALTNVVRHADATSCRVELGRRGDELVLVVADDGRGLPAGHPDGVGLASMRERAEELGGSTSVETGGGGTVVTTRLPVRHER